ncbi:hypothetical protein [Rhizobium mayense]|uniref:Uncharacterized protein n=1 Tax=Rhizobium mayense TaxID=1312184 RepID=A0ABT7JT72_9HYPH|nr:hypothetical protein [Rhizobium mayense]MDL2398134.1 hypothetical protein [Rhizobium mayense]
MSDLFSIETASGALQFDGAVGNIPQLRLRSGERWIEPLHVAPWRDEPDVQTNPAISPVERRLAGDFFCAPFAASVDPAVPGHGWTANSAWKLQARAASWLDFVLVRDVSGAMITKRLVLADDAPLLYQQHMIEGGRGALPVAHHPMFRLSGRGRFFTSKKKIILTPAQPLEPGRSCLAYPTRSTDLEKVAGVNGGNVDLTHWPIGTRNEDFVTLVEEPGSVLGWSAVIRESEDDIVFCLKDPSVLPATMLWFSNGGRDYAPWSGRHLGVTGIEDGCAPALGGEAEAGRPNPVSGEGVATGLSLAAGRRHVIRHVIGAIARPPGWTEIADISASADVLAILDGAGRRIELPWRQDFLKGRN